MKRTNQTLFILAAILAVIAIVGDCCGATNRHPVLEKPAAELFRAGEFQLDLNAFTRTDSSLADFDNGGGFGVNYFHTRNLGIGLDFQTEDTASAFFDRIGVAGIARWPVGASAFAPEVKLGYSYDFERGDNDRHRTSSDKKKKDEGDARTETFYTNDGNGHEAFASVGGEWRLTKSFGIGAEARIVKPLDGRNEYWLGILRGRLNF